jgi:hypothetical protein
MNADDHFYIPLHPEDGGVLLFDTTSDGLAFLALRADASGGNGGVGPQTPLFLGRKGPFKDAESLQLFSSTDPEIAPYLHSQRQACAVWHATKRNLRFVDFTTYNRALSSVAYVASQGAAMADRLTRMSKLALTALLNDEGAWEDPSARKHAILGLIEATDADGAVITVPWKGQAHATPRQMLFFPRASKVTTQKLLSVRKDLSCNLGRDFFARLSEGFRPRPMVAPASRKSPYRNPFLDTEAIDRDVETLLMRIQQVLQKDASVKPAPFHVEPVDRPRVTFADEARP